MYKYFFVLGKNPALSVAEIISYLDHNRFPYNIDGFSREILLIDSNTLLKAYDLMTVLGGTVKIGEIVDSASFEESESKFTGIFSADNLLANYLAKTSGKIHTGISIYNCGGNNEYVKALFNDLSNLNSRIKINLQGKNLKAGFVRIKERTLSSVSVVKNELLTKGAEFVLVVTADKLLIGKTRAVQEFASFSFRDYGRPERDKRSGIMPPKLARMMINLAEVDKNSVILYPFCGSGTILQEGILLGFKSIIGSDKAIQAVKNSKENLDWLFRNFKHLNQADFKLKIYQQDVRKLTKIISYDSIDAIVTEPFLGPPLYNKPSGIDINNIFNEVGQLILDSFNQFHEILKSSGSIVIIFPSFEESGRNRFLEILDRVENLGFRVKELIPKNLLNIDLWEYTGRGSIIFGDKYHFVKREIIKFVRI